MAISVTSLGSNSTVTGASGATLALSSLTVPAGALIVVMVTQGDNISFGAGCTVADDATNTYTEISHLNNNNQASVGFGQLFYAKNVSALSSQSITVTKQNNNAALVVEAIYATGVDTTSPLDSAVTATAFGQNTTPSVTGGVGTQSGNLVVGAMCWQDTTATTATQPGGSWTDDANTKNASATTRVAGATTAHQVNAGTGALTYNPTLANTNRWAAFIAAFKPAAGVAVVTPGSNLVRSRFVHSNLTRSRFIH